MDKIGNDFLKLLLEKPSIKKSVLLKQTTQISFTSFNLTYIECKSLLSL